MKKSLLALLFLVPLEPSRAQFDSYLIWEDDGVTSWQGITSVFSLYDNTSLCLYYSVTPLVDITSASFICTTLALAGTPWAPLPFGHPGYYMKIEANKPVVWETESYILSNQSDRQGFIHSDNASYVGGTFYTYLDFDHGDPTNSGLGDALTLFNTGGSSCPVTVSYWNGSAYVTRFTATVAAGGVWNQGGSTTCGTLQTDTGYYRVTSGCTTLMLNKGTVGNSDRDQGWALAPSTQSSRKAGRGTFYGFALGTANSIVVTGLGPGSSNFSVECYNPTGGKSGCMISGSPQAGVASGTWAAVTTGTVALGDAWVMAPSAVCGQGPYRVNWTSGGDMQVAMGSGVGNSPWGDGDYLNGASPGHLALDTLFYASSPDGSGWQGNWVSLVCPNASCVTVTTLDGAGISDYKNIAGGMVGLGSLSTYTQCTTGPDQALAYKIATGYGGDIRINTSTPCYAFYMANPSTNAQCTGCLERVYSAATPFDFFSSLEITKGANLLTASPGNTVTYTLTYENTGQNAVTSAQVWDTIPATMTFLSSVPAPSSGPNPVYWNLGTLAPGATGTIRVAVAISPSATVPQTIINNASFFGISPNLYVPATASHGLPLLPTDLRLNKAANPTVAPVGGTVTYTLCYTNQGDSAATSVILTDGVPSDINFLGAGSGGALNSGAVSWNLGTVAAATTYYQMTIWVATIVSGPWTNSPNFIGAGGLGFDGSIAVGGSGTLTGAFSSTGITGAGGEIIDGVSFNLRVRAGSDDDVSFRWLGPSCSKPVSQLSPTASLATYGWDETAACAWTWAQLNGLSVELTRVQQSGPDNIQADSANFIINYHTTSPVTTCVNWWGTVKAGTPGGTIIPNIASIDSAEEQPVNSQDAPVTVGTPPSPTPTATWTPTRTFTPTWTPTRTFTHSPTETPTATSSPSSTPTRTPTFSPTYSATPSWTLSWTPTSTPTFSTTWTPTRTSTPTYTTTFTYTHSPTLTFTRTSTPTFTPSSTPTSSASPTPTFSWTRTSTQTHTYTWSPSFSSTRTWTPSVTPSASPTYSASETQTSTHTPTWTATHTHSLPPTRTPTDTASPTATASDTLTWSPTPTDTVTDTPSATASASPSPTDTETHTATDSPTLTPSATPSSTSTESASPTYSASPTPTATTTDTPTETVTASPSHTATASPTESPTSTPTPTRTPSPTDSSTATASASPTLSASSSGTSTPTPSFSSTPTPSPTPTLSGSPTETPTSSPSPTPSPSRTVTGTASPSRTPSPSRTISATSTETPENVLVVSVRVYNEAGEVVALIAEGLLVEYTVNEFLFGDDNNTITEDHPQISLVFPGDGTNAPTTLTWDGRGLDGGSLANGAYVVKVETIDGFGLATVITGSASILRAESSVTVRVFNEAGELVWSEVRAGTTVDQSEVIIEGTTVNPSLPASSPGGSLRVDLGGAGTVVWNGRDGTGTPLANGEYVLEVTVRVEGSESIISATVTLIGGPAPALVVSLAPNPAVPGQGVEIRLPSAALGSRVRIYTVSGELVRTLTGSGDTLVWGQDDAGGSPVSAGLYLLLIETRSADGSRSTALVRLLILR